MSVQLFREYSGTSRFEMTEDETNYKIVLRHDLGNKYSIFLKHAYESALKTGPKVVSEIEVSVSSLFVNLPAVFLPNRTKE